MQNRDRKKLVTGAVMFFLGLFAGIESETVVHKIFSSFNPPPAIAIQNVTKESERQIPGALPKPIEDKLPESKTIGSEELRKKYAEWKLGESKAILQTSLLALAQEQNGEGLAIYIYIPQNELGPPQDWRRTDLKRIEKINFKGASPICQPTSEVLEKDKNNFVLVCTSLESPVNLYSSLKFRFGRRKVNEIVASNKYVIIDLENATSKQELGEDYEEQVFKENCKLKPMISCDDGKFYLWKKAEVAESTLGLSSMSKEDLELIKNFLKSGHFEEGFDFNFKEKSLTVRLVKKRPRVDDDWDEYLVYGYDGQKNLKFANLIRSGKFTSCSDPVQNAEIIRLSCRGGDAEEEIEQTFHIDPVNQKIK